MKKFSAVILTVFVLIGTAGAASAAPPGPGDAQCVPGQQGNPHPGFKAGTCRNG